MTLPLGLIIIAWAVLLGQANEARELWGKRESTTDKPPLTAGAHFACVDENKTLGAMGGGYALGSFPRIVDDCSKDNINLVKGVMQDEFITCLERATNLSRNCASCYYPACQYGFQHCKFACIGSWCSQTCLDCTFAAQAGVNACAGIPGPRPTPCDGIPANETGAENVWQFLMRLMKGRRKYSNGKQQDRKEMGSAILHMALVGPAAMTFIGFGSVGLGIWSLLKRKRRQEEYGSRTAFVAHVDEMADLAEEWNAPARNEHEPLML